DRLLALVRKQYPQGDYQSCAHALNQAADWASRLEDAPGVEKEREIHLWQALVWLWEPGPQPATIARAVGRARQSLGAPVPRGFRPYLMDLCEALQAIARGGIENRENAAAARKALEQALAQDLDAGYKKQLRAFLDRITATDRKQQ